MNTTNLIKPLAGLLLLTAVGIGLFWTLFFADLPAQRDSYFASRCPAWFHWEISFPLADTWTAVTAFLAAVGLWQKRPYGLLFSLVSGGAMVFLGLIDILFFLQNGLYFPLHSEVIVEALIHIWLTAIGLAAIAVSWSQRRQLGC